MSGYQVGSAILDGARALIESHGKDPEAMARECGLLPAALDDPRLMVPAIAVLRFFERAAQACQDPCWGLRLSRSARLAPVLGPLWILLRNARSVEQMCEQMADNFDLYTDAAVMRVERVADGAMLEWSTTAGQGSNEVQMAEYAMSIFSNEIRSHVEPGWHPTAVLFRHARVAPALDLHHAAFGNDLRFNQDRNALMLDRAALETPLLPRGAAARALAGRMLRLAEAQEGSRLAPRVEAVVRALMPYGPCGMGEVSEALGMAPRTLQAHLSREGRSLREVRDAVRADLAMKYLRGSRLDAAQIADILGYADITSLSRSFRRWHGRSMRDLRRDRSR